MTPTYDLPFFRRLFEATTDDQWCCFVRTDPEGRHCALGFCDPLDEADGSKPGDGNGPRAEALLNLFEANPWDCIAVRINNGDDPRYTQPTPRARMLAALEDLASGVLLPVG